MKVDMDGQTVTTNPTKYKVNSLGSFKDAKQENKLAQLELVRI